MGLGFRHKVALVSALCVVITLAVAFVLLDRMHQRQYEESMVQQARMLFRQVVITRMWIADHEGIFVEKLPWVQPNPYLENPQMEAVGKTYVKENPAMVTRELSEYSRKHAAYWFHITSLKPINPNNAPDTFERAALERLGRKEATEHWGVEALEGKSSFRYIAPLLVEAACLKCHAKHGYKLGDVRGGISVTFPIDATLAMFKRERLLMAVLILVVAAALVLALNIAMARVVVDPLARLRAMASAFGKEATSEAPDAQSHGMCEGMSPDVMNPKDELQGLFLEFCRMRELIASHQRDQGRKIDEATAELTNLNERIALAMERYRGLSTRKSEFITSLTHELRTPLTSIKGAAGYLTERMQRPDIHCAHSQELVPFLQIIDRNINRFIKLVEDAHNLEKIETGHLEMHEELVDLRTLLQEAQQELHDQAQRREILLELAPCPDPLWAMADPIRIRQVLDNLLINAIRHSPEADTVTMSGCTSGQWNIVTVHDQGQGLTPDKQRRVFEQFFKESKDGSGLGLTISKHIVEAHRGVIGVESTPGAGAEFYFKLPVATVPTDMEQG